MFVFSNLAMSLDGKIATTDRSFYPIGTPFDRKEMLRLRDRCDAILMGASTIRFYKKPCLSSQADSWPANVIVSSELDGFAPDWPLFKKKGLRRLLLVGPEIKPARVRNFSKVAEVFVLKKATSKNPLSLQIVQLLEKQGLQRILIEGGGQLMWEFAEHNLIDQYHVTLTPRILGGSTAPTLVDGRGFSPDRSLNLKLVQSKVVGDEIFLSYRKTEKLGQII